MELGRIVVRAGVGGVVGASALGLGEAFWLASQGAPDGVAPLYAVILYGLLGLPFGLATGAALVAIRRWLVVTPQRAVAIGAVGSFAPMAVFILRYLANKTLYGELGVPLVGNLAILAVVTAVAVLVLLLVPAALRGLLRRVDDVKGALLAEGSLVVVGGVALALHPVADPRSSFAHGQVLSETLRDRPNVIVILVDTLRADHLGTYGADGARTPTIDALAADSVVFENAFSNASWTRASSASLLSSRLPAGHTAAQKASRLPEDVTTFFEVLHGGGYTTGALVNNINLASTFGFNQGFDTFLYESPAYPFGATESVFGLTFYKVVQKVAEKAGGRKDVHTYYQPADVVLGDAKAFVEANDGARWALLVHLMEPHDPYFGHPVIEGTGAEEYDGTGFARAEVEKPKLEDAERLHHLYRSEVAFLDTKLAPFVTWLKDSGHYDDTLIVFTADHGEEFAEHGGFWHGTTLYDEQVHVPLIVKQPRQVDAGVRVPWQVQSLDVAPSVVAAAGLASDPLWEGTPVQPLIGAWKAVLHPPPAPPMPEPAPPVVPSDTSPVPAAVAPVEVPLPWTAPGPCDPPEALDRPVYAEEDFEGNQVSAIRTRTFKYIKANAGNPRGLPEDALFHVAEDAGEQHNLAGTPSQVCGSYPDSVKSNLDEQLGARIVRSASHATGAAEVKIDAAECERLKSLGYMDPATNCE